MCCEDIKIDYHKRAEHSVVALTNADQPLVGAVPDRCALIIGQPVSGDAWAVPDATAVLGKGFHLSPTLPPLVVDRYHYGNLAGKAWRIIHSAGGVNISVVETLFLPGGICDDNAKRPSAKFY